MRKITLLTLLTFCYLIAIGQKQLDMGIFAGTSYYMGDINPGRQFYSPALSLGGMVKYNFNTRYAVKGQLTYGSLSADDLDFNNEFQQLRGAEFSTNFLDAIMQFEFNFTSFVMDVRTKSFSPYINAGVGYSLLLNSSTGASNQLILPFGLGVKMSFNRRLGGGIEWSLRKTFKDDLDGLVNPGEDTYSSIAHNNDWYSVAGIYITYKLFDNRGDCPVYW